MALYECVPNVSCGRNPLVTKALADELRSVKGCCLINVDPGYDADRTVFTIVGDPEGLLTAMYRLYARVLALVDMHQYVGNHPAVGALDVCPFVPLSEDARLDVCKDLALRLAERVASEFGLPIFLYRESALHSDRSELAVIRQGGIDGLQRRLGSEGWFPDFGPMVMHPTFGASIIGARPVLIAYNVNLQTADVSVAKRIAAQIREGSNSKYALKCCRTIGWSVDNGVSTQVSTNLVDYRQTGMLEVYQAVMNLANQVGVLVTGSELIGMVPEDALLAALGGQEGSWAAGKMEQYRAVVASLGLSDRAPFHPEERVIECRLAVLAEE